MSLTRGLTLGKFAPLHRGHQHLIETALREVDELVVIIYDSPEFIDVPLPVRAQWIRDLYPSIQIIEAWGGPMEVGNTPEIQRMHEAYIIGELGVRGITHFYSSEFYGEHMSRALGAVDRRVDPERSAVPICGTEVRTDPFGCRAMIHPRVYRDLITNVVLLGAPSTGKTTLAEELAKRLDTAWMPEYGREYWDAHQVERRLTLEQLVEIAEGHLEREEAMLLQANRCLITDTNAVTTLLFSRYYHREAAARLTELADIAARRYDLVFVCDTDIPYDNTWDRSGEVNRTVMQMQVLSELAARRVPYFMLRGTVEQRIEQVLAVLALYRKDGNVLDIARKLSDASPEISMMSSD